MRVWAVRVWLAISGSATSGVVQRTLSTAEATGTTLVPGTELQGWRVKLPASMNLAGMTIAGVADCENALAFAAASPVGGLSRQQ